MKIAFTGVPSSGKTTLARDITKIVKGVYVPEIARIYIKSINRKLNFGDQYFIAKLQSETEKVMYDVGKIMICDAPVYISAVYEDLYFDKKDSDKIRNLSKQHNYDLVFNLTSVPFYHDDGVRYQTKTDLLRLNELINIYNQDYNTEQIFTVNQKERVDQVLDRIYFYAKTLN